MQLLSFAISLVFFPYTYQVILAPLCNIFHYDTSWTHLSYYFMKLKMISKL